mmetsp:Transcript_83715/g.249880  ORF Transcript_83715/g.249880 Transcript_83715/m.249880 type:complete len:231 (+) Transcript_83715:88-780(+)
MGDWQKESRCPYAIRPESWKPPVSRAYGSALAKETVPKHMKDISMAVNFTQWGIKPTSQNWDVPTFSDDQMTVAAASQKLAGLARSGQSTATTTRAGTPERELRELKSRRLRPEGTVLAGTQLASRGLVTGSQPQWSFERMPSLLQQPLLRGTGQRAFGVAPRTPGPRERQPLPAGDARSAIQRSPSAPSIYRSPPKCGGLHGVIGMTWDNAATCAGGAYRGADGQHLGF